MCLALPALAHGQVPFDVLHTFDGRADYGVASTSITAAQGGSFYVTTARGGAHGHGAVLKVAADGSSTVLHAFSGGVDGSTPLGRLVRAADGYYYGTTERGGVQGLGTIYSVGPDDIVRLAWSFSGSSGAYPKAGLALGADGNLYGTASHGGAYDFGTIFRTTGTTAPSLVHSFEGGYLSGAYPAGRLVLAADGSFYGVTPGLLAGTLYRITPAGVVKIVTTFDNGEKPTGEVLDTPGGLLVTTVTQGLWASIHRFRNIPGFPGLVGERVHTFQPEETGRIDALVQTTNGTVVGTTSTGGQFGHGALFRLSADCTITTLDDFPSGKADALVLATDDSIWGTSSARDSGGNATVFSLSDDDEIVVRGTFGAARAGAKPAAPLLRAADGYFYGTTIDGGAHGLGTLYRIAPSGVLTTLHSFAGGFDGASPRSALIQARDGNFYGVTSEGGVYERGTAFRLNAGGDLTVLHSFGATASDPAEPSTPLVEAADGSFYGGTGLGGAEGWGTIFRMTAGGGVTVVRSFADMPGLGRPGSLVLGADGNLYGTAERYCGGSVFRMWPDGRLTTLYAIHLTDGAYSCVPMPGIVRGRNGSLYGTTRAHASGAVGTFYNVLLDGQVVVLRRWTQAEEYPTGPVTEGSDGNFYFISQRGNVVQLTSSGVTRVYHTASLPFVLGTGTYYPPREATIVQAPDGHLYGSARESGPFGAGIIFRLRSGATTPATLRGISVRDGGVRIAWTGSSGAASYTVRRANGSGGPVVVATGITGTAWLDTTASTGQTYRYTVSAVNAFGESVGSYEVTITAGRAAAGDFDGDGRADVAVFRPSAATWYIEPSSTRVGVSYLWGAADDQPVVGDYDGDGRVDRAVFRPSTGEWFIVRSASDTQIGHTWGASTDVPVPGDYDGDGTTDVAVFRPSTGAWYILHSASGTSVQYAWGGSADRPAPADYDGDGRTDVAVFRPATGEWHILRSESGTGATFTWGGRLDTPVPADYDGDGRADLAVFREATGTWHLLRSATTTGATYTWGGSIDTPVPADFDGDGQADVAVFRPPTGAWHILRSATGTSTRQTWGGSIDLPLSSLPTSSRP